jgi:acyl-CoA reductase-like NAD-dependent aldehyde dehydrogenase
VPFGADDFEESNPHNPAYKQEFFGPVALVLPAKDEEKAIAIVNDSPALVLR